MEDIYQSHQVDVMKQTCIIQVETRISDNYSISQLSQGPSSLPSRFQMGIPEWVKNSQSLSKLMYKLINPHSLVGMFLIPLMVYDNKLAGIIYDTLCKLPTYMLSLVFSSIQGPELRVIYFLQV